LLPSSAVTVYVRFWLKFLAAEGFGEEVEYTVTALDQSSVVYTVKTKLISFINISCVNNTFNLENKYYTGVNPIIKTIHMDFSVVDSKLVLENDVNSYELDYNILRTQVTNDVIQNVIKIEFSANIATATNYKLKYFIG